MSTIEKYRIALVHDELTRRGGAELVLEELLRLYPQADVHALYAGRPIISVNHRSWPVYTTYLQKLPRWFRRHPSRLLPLLPFAAEQLDLSDYDLVVSSSSGFAKNVITRATVPHLSYCHTPTRYLWDDTLTALRQRHRLTRGPSKALLHLLRLSDYAGAQRVDHFLANSKWTAARILKYYGRSSSVVYPPINTHFFTPGKSSIKTGNFLCVGRLTPAKCFNQAIIACEKLELPLTIVGSGNELKHLRRLAGKYTTFAGSLSDNELRDHYRSARALLQPAAEDFGMASAEAQSCGLPIIAYDVGGVREIVKTGVTGLLYSPSHIESLTEAIRQYISNIERNLDREEMQIRALQFSRHLFHTNMDAAITTALHLKNKIGVAND